MVMDFFANISYAFSTIYCFLTMNEILLSSRAPQGTLERVAFAATTVENVNRGRFPSPPTLYHTVPNPSAKKPYEVCTTVVPPVRPTLDYRLALPASNYGQRSNASDPTIQKRKIRTIHHFPAFTTRYTKKSTIENKKPAKQQQQQQSRNMFFVF